MSTPEQGSAGTERLEELVPWLFSRTTGGVRWGLERTQELLAGVGDPHRLFRSVHVAGTNGKGSVAAMTAAALLEAARGGGASGPIGLYTSPHLVSFNERIRIDGAPASDDLVASAASRLRPDIERTGATFFEATTALAFLCFAEAGVRTAVVEVGLGGRLDATNVIEPMACAITNISREHTEYLGNSIAEIAREKAGILKPGVRAISGVPGGSEDGEAARAVIRAAADGVGAPLVELDETARIEVRSSGSDGTTLRLESRHWGDRTIAVPLTGEHQARNAALAAELLALLPDDLRPPWSAVAAGFAGVRWPGRLQLERIRGTTWLLDVAHNPAGVATLAAAMDRLDLPRPRVLLFAALSDKDWRAMLTPLLARVDAVVLTMPETAPAGRRWDPGQAAAWAEMEVGPPVRVIPDLGEAVSRAATLAPHGSIVVAGSFHTVGDTLVELGLHG